MAVSKKATESIIDHLVKHIDWSPYKHGGIYANVEEVDKVIEAMTIENGWEATSIDIARNLMRKSSDGNRYYAGEQKFYTQGGFASLQGFANSPNALSTQIYHNPAFRTKWETIKDDPDYRMLPERFIELTKYLKTMQIRENGRDSNRYDKLELILEHNGSNTEIGQLPISKEEQAKLKQCIDANLYPIGQRLSHLDRVFRTALTELIIKERNLPDQAVDNLNRLGNALNDKDLAADTKAAFSAVIGNEKKIAEAKRDALRAKGLPTGEKTSTIYHTIRSDDPKSRY